MAFPTIKLAFVACKLADPTACDEYVLRYSADAQDITPMQCMMSSQQPLAEWINQHPGVRIARFTCGLDRGEVAKI